MSNKQEGENKKTKNRGFTLVELAIVLVIIGLLIGGILVAQSMINTQKVQAFCRQIAQFDAAVSTFRDKFRGLPGDSYIYNPAVGDGDGIIESAVTVGADTPGSWLAAGQMANFWLQLYQNGFKNDEMPGVPFATAYAANFPINAQTPNTPKGKTGNNIGIIPYGGATVVSLGLTYPGNVYMAMDCTNSTALAAIRCNNGFSGPDAASIDAKIDNGLGTSGNIVARTLAADVASWATIRDGAAVNFAVTTLTSNAHILIIRMGSQTGELY